MTANAFALYDTPIGVCAVAWGSRGIAGSRLPQRDAVALRAQMTEQYPGALEAKPPPQVASAIEAIRALLSGEACDLSAVVLDMEGVPEFNRRVYEIARSIPPGTTRSYGDIATLLGDGTLSRAVGQALGQNPFAPIVPCHRVISADGRMHGFSSSGGVAMKLRMLQIEGWRADQLSFFD